MPISASEARKTLFPLIEQVNDGRQAVEIVSRKGNAVLMAADEYAAWQETAYLFRSPAKARRLLDAYERARSGKTEPTSSTGTNKCDSSGIVQDGTTASTGKLLTGAFSRESTP